jgi:L-asparaginase / beta-aspartyl-peptidase
MKNQYSLMIHGGAENSTKSEADKLRYQDILLEVLQQGREILKKGGNAIQAVERCAILLEDNPLFNAGCGSVLDEKGKVEMDAAIMDGRDLSAGAVAGISYFANPIRLARLVMTESQHVMLIGEGAMRFADICGLQRMPEEYFITPERVEELKQVKLLGEVLLDYDQARQEEANKYGTIGAVALDVNGNLAAATSTGGLINKKFGRLGDSPIIGAGVFADNETCGVSATGYGEDFIRTVLSKRVSDMIEFKNYNAQKAAKAAIEYLVRKVNGRGGIIVIDKAGHCACQYTTKHLIHAFIEKGGESVCRF